MIIQNNYENVLENEKLTQMKYKTIFSKEKDKKGKKDRIYIFDSDSVWRMQLIII